MNNNWDNIVTPDVLYERDIQHYMNNLDIIAHYVQFVMEQDLRPWTVAHSKKLMNALIELLQANKYPIRRSPCETCAYNTNVHSLTTMGSKCIKFEEGSDDKTCTYKKAKPYAENE